MVEESSRSSSVMVIQRSRFRYSGEERGGWEGGRDHSRRRRGVAVEFVDSAVGIVSVRYW